LTALSSGTGAFRNRQSANAPAASARKGDRHHSELEPKETEMHIDGGCHCGFIRYEAEIDPETVSICHCTDCQTLSGSAFRTNVPAKKENFRMLGGQPKIYIKTAESGNKRAQAFCPECGAPIYATSPTDPQIYGIRVSSARQRTELRPKRQNWCRSALDWVADLGSIPRFPKQPG
jgi:hypothetical protein